MAASRAVWGTVRACITLLATSSSGVLLRTTSTRCAPHSASGRVASIRASRAYSGVRRNANSRASPGRIGTSVACSASCLSSICILATIAALALVKLGAVTAGRVVETAGAGHAGEATRSRFFTSLATSAHSVDLGLTSRADTAGLRTSSGESVGSTVVADISTSSRVLVNSTDGAGYSSVTRCALALIGGRVHLLASSAVTCCTVAGGATVANSTRAGSTFRGACSRCIGTGRAGGACALTQSTISTGITGGITCSSSGGASIARVARGAAQGVARSSEVGAYRARSSAISANKIASIDGDGTSDSSSGGDRVAGGSSDTHLRGGRVDNCQDAALGNALREKTHDGGTIDIVSLNSSSGVAGVRAHQSPN